MAYVELGPDSIRLPQIVIPKPVVQGATEALTESGKDLLKQPGVWIAAASLGMLALNLVLAIRGGR